MTYWFAFAHVLIRFWVKFKNYFTADQLIYYYSLFHYWRFLPYWFYVVDYLRLNHVITLDNKDVARLAMTTIPCLVYIEIGKRNWDPFQFVCCFKWNVNVWSPMKIYHQEEKRWRQLSSWKDDAFMDWNERNSRHDKTCDQDKWCVFLTG